MLNSGVEKTATEHNPTKRINIIKKEIIILIMMMMAITIAVLMIIF